MDYKNVTLNSIDPLTRLLIEKDIQYWDKFVEYLRDIPYGRNSDRTKFSLIITENKGTCSSKHALAKEIADLNSIENIKLILAIYKMNESNTPGIGTYISNNQLDYIPEAHCYLNINGQRIDLTNPDSDIIRIKNDILSETEINPDQVGQYKVKYHMHYIQSWIVDHKIKLSFDKVWAIRESCIASLSNN